MYQLPYKKSFSREGFRTDENVIKYTFSSYCLPVPRVLASSYVSLTSTHPYPHPNPGSQKSASSDNASFFILVKQEEVCLTQPSKERYQDSSWLTGWSYMSALPWTFLFLPEFRWWNLIPTGMVSGGWTFGKGCIREGGALLNGISVLITETLETSFSASATWEHGKQTQQIMKVPKL